MQRNLKKKSVTLDNINEGVKQTKYDVRGEIYLAATKRVAAGKEVIYTNVGNPHALGQMPMTFSRQVLALCMAPFLLEHPLVNSMFAPDAIDRAKVYLSHIKGGLGAYSDSKGNLYIRKEISTFIEDQSGVRIVPCYFLRSFIDSM
jgi:glutamate--glyoxylate aminotransferase